MNVRNQMDICLDDALNEHMRSLFRAYFSSGDLEKLMSELRKIEAVYKNADKALNAL